MKRKQQQRQDTPQGYRLIHSKNNQSSKRISTQYNQPNQEYFPTRKIQKQIQNHYLDVSRTTSHKELSETSKTYTRSSGYNNSFKQEQRGLEKEIKNLKRQLQRYHKISIQRDDKNSIIKKVEQQLIQAYRAIDYYESKVREMEKFCRMYESTLNQDQIIKKGKQNKISDIMEEHRNWNIQLSIQLDKKDKILEQMNRKVGNLELKKVQNQYRIKSLQKQITEHTKKKKQIKITKNRYIDDYEQQHLMGSQLDRNPQKRLNLSKNKRTVKLTSGQSSAQESNNRNQYKSNYFKQKQKKADVVSDRESSVRSLGKANVFGNLNSKLNLIQNELMTLKKQNQRLNEQLNRKVSEIIKLKSLNHQLEIKLTLIKQTNNKKQQEPKKIVIQKNLLKQIHKPQPPTNNEMILQSSTDSSNNKLSMFVSNVSRSSISATNECPQVSRQKQIKEPIKSKCGKKTNFKAQYVSSQIVTKIIVSVIKTQITYEQLVTVIAECWSSQQPYSLSEALQNVDCQLTTQVLQCLNKQYTHIINYISSKESEQAKKDLEPKQYKKYLHEEIKNIMLDIIPPYKNITFRRQFTINIQLANKFKNYQPQFLLLAEKYENKMPLSVFMSQVSDKWGLSMEQFMCMLIKSNQDFGGTIDYIQFEELGNFYLQD